MGLSASVRMDSQVDILSVLRRRKTDRVVYSGCHTPKLKYIGQEFYFRMASSTFFQLQCNACLSNVLWCVICTCAQVNRYRISGIYWECKLHREICVR